MSQESPSGRPITSRQRRFILHTRRTSASRRQTSGPQRSIVPPLPEGCSSASSSASTTSPT